MRTAFVLLALLGAALPAAAQELPARPMPGPDDLFVDRVIAIVGDSALFYSDLRERINQIQADGTVPPVDPAGRAAFEREVLDALVVETVILRAAVQDTLITVSEDRIEADFQLAWEQEVRSFGSEEALRTAVATAGRTLAQHRTIRREEVRRRLLQQSYIQLQQREIRVPPVEEAEIRAYFDREREQLGTRPATLSFRQVVLVPQPSEAARAEARAEAERILGQIREGGDFAELAQRFSDDAGSGQRGGEVGWIRQGTRLQEFEDAVFRLGRGQISDVVETSFGAHIIRVDRIRGPERLVFHILISATITDADVGAARTRAEEIRAAVAGGAALTSFPSQGPSIGIPDQIEVARDQFDQQLPAGYGFALRGAGLGDVVGPIEFVWQGQSALAVAEIIAVREAGAFAYEDLRDQIRNAILQDRFQERLIDRLMTGTHVEIRL